MVRRTTLWLLAFVCVVGGCGFQFFPTGDPNSTGTDPNATTPPGFGVYPGKVYLVGQLRGVLIEELAVACPNMLPYDGTSTDAPILIDANAVGTLTDTAKASILAAFQARQPIALIQATPQQVDAAYEHLLKTTHQHRLAVGYGYLEVYGLDLETGGDLYELEHYPPVSADYTDNSTDQQGRVDYLVAWLKQNGQRKPTGGAAKAHETLKLAAQMDGSSGDLTSLAQGFVTQKLFGEYGNHYQASFYIYSCHSMTSGDDWFYIQEKCAFDSNVAYAPSVQWATGIGSEIKGWYLGQVEMDNYINGYLDQPSVVDLEGPPIPETVNNETTISNGIDFDIGGDLTYTKEGPEAGISAGMSITHSTEFSVQDCTVTNECYGQGNDAHWLYVFARPQAYNSFAYGSMPAPPTLATKTFTPENDWIWRVTPQVRQSNASMHVSLYTTLVKSQAFPLFFFVVQQMDQTTSGGSIDCDIPLTYPAITTQPSD